MDPDTRPPDPPTGFAPPHRAPPRDERPRAGLATAALSVAVGLAVLTALAGGAWVVMLPALLLGCWAWARVRPEASRGRGLAIVAVVLSLVVGSCSYYSAKLTRDTTERLATAVLAALRSPEEGRLEKWLTESAREGGVSERVRQRYAAVTEAFGPYAGELLLPSRWLGVGAYLAHPRNVEEVGASADAPWTHPQEVLWLRARFRDGPVHVVLVLPDGPLEGLSRAVTTAMGEGAGPVLEDVRFFRDP